MQGSIIPHTEPAGNYNFMIIEDFSLFIIPHTEPAGNYNSALSLARRYTTHRTNGELQHGAARP